MYVYSVETTLGRQAKAGDGPSTKYRIKRVNTAITAPGAGRCAVIRDGLGYEQAEAMVKGFNTMEARSQNIRREQARHQSALKKSS